MERFSSILLRGMARTLHGVNDDDELCKIDNQANPFVRQAYRLVYRGIAKIVQPTMVQARHGAPRFQCSEILTATEFTRSMMGMAHDPSISSADRRSAMLGVADLHSLEDEWLTERRDVGEGVAHVWFDVMCFPKQGLKSCDDEAMTSVTVINLLASVKFIQSHFKLCTRAAVTCCAQKVYLIAPATDIVIISKCLVPYLHLVVPLHRSSLPKKAFLATPLIIDALASAPPRSLYLKWAMFVLFSLFHRHGEDPVDFMFDDLVTKGCALRAEAARWRLLDLCRQYTAYQKLEQEECDPHHLMGYDYVDYVTDDLKGEDCGFEHDAVCSDSDEESENEQEQRRCRIMQHQANMSDLMCRIKDMTRAADVSVTWSIPLHDLEAVIDSCSSEDGVPSVLLELQKCSQRSGTRTVVGSSEIMSPVMHRTFMSLDVGGAASDDESVSSSPRAQDGTLLHERSPSSDTCPTSDSESPKDVASETSQVSGCTYAEAITRSNVVLVPQHVATSVLIEMACHPEISEAMASMNLAASVPKGINRRNEPETLVYKRLQTRRFENSVAKITKKEYRALYSKKGGGSRSKPICESTAYRIQNAIAMMCSRHLPGDIHASTRQALSQRWVHRDGAKCADAHYAEQEFQCRMHLNWEHLERTVLEYEEALRNFRPGAHGVHGIHELRRVRMSFKRTAVTKRRKINEASRLGGAFAWADKRVELCVFSNCATHQTFPLCARANVQAETLTLLHRHGALPLFTAAYAHAVQPGKRVLPSLVADLESSQEPKDARQNGNAC